MSDKFPTKIGFIQGKNSEGNFPAVTFTVDQAVLSDASRVIDVIANSFMHDPTWSWAFPNPVARKVFWRLCIDGALRYSWVFKTNGFEAVSVWIPPNETEFLPEDEERLPDLVKELVGVRAIEVMELLQRFGDAHPCNQPHYYLSLLGTESRHRGHGLGMALLKENLVRIDLEQMPAYLESSNPKNNQRYESVGFVPVVSFQAPNNGPTITGMWRQGK
jgi:GNAT superfamily N-acetyltransferase